MALSIVFSVLAGVLLLLGFLGTFVPVLPGAPGQDFCLPIFLSITKYL